MTNDQQESNKNNEKQDGLLCEVAIGEELASQQLTECTISKKEKS